MNLTKLNSVVAGITVLAIGFFLGRAVNTAAGANSFVYDFQTLIAGSLATVAAAWTVTQMQISDDQARSRHGEMLELQLRRDRLITARAGLLAENLRRWAEHAPQYGDAVGDDALAASQLNIYQQDSSAWCDNLKGILDSRAIEQVLDLLEPEMERSRQAILVGLTRCRELQNWDGPNPQGTYARLREAMDFAGTFAIDFGDALIELKRKYETSRQR